MTESRRLTAGSLPPNSRPIGADERDTPVPSCLRGLWYVVVLLGIASAVWWASFVSRRLTVAYAEGFRGVRLLEK